MKYVKLLSLIVAFGVAAAAQTALAFQKEVPFRFGDAKPFLRDASRTGSGDKVGLLAPTRLEVINKNSLIQIKLQDPKKFSLLRANHPENSPLYESWMDEVDEALAGRHLKAAGLGKNTNFYQRFFVGTPVDVAKKIAKKELYLALEKNWPWIKDTVFNEYATDTWNRKPAIHSPEAPLQTETPGGSDLAVERINQLFRFSPKDSHGDYYVFRFDDFGRSFVEINKRSFRVGRVGLDIDSDHDVNRLEEGADKITADESSVTDDNTSANNSASNSSGSAADLPPPQNNFPPSPADFNNNGNNNGPSPYAPPDGGVIDGGYF